MELVTQYSYGKTSGIKTIYPTRFVRASFLVCKQWEYFTSLVPWEPWADQSICTTSFSRNQQWTWYFDEQTWSACTWQYGPWWLDSVLRWCWLQSKEILQISAPERAPRSQARWAHPWGHIFFFYTCFEGFFGFLFLLFFPKVFEKRPILFLFFSCEALCEKIIVLHGEALCFSGSTPKKVKTHSCAFGFLFFVFCFVRVSKSFHGFFSFPFSEKSSSKLINKGSSFKHLDVRNATMKTVCDLEGRLKR